MDEPAAVTGARRFKASFRLAVAQSRCFTADCSGKMRIVQLTIPPERNRTAAIGFTSKAAWNGIMESRANRINERSQVTSAMFVLL